MLVSHLLYARIHLSTSVILPACLTDAAWKLGIFIQLLSVCQSREMLFTQHQLDEVQHALCVTGPACSTHSENKDKVWPVPPGCLHFSWPHIVCVGVCNSSRVISLQSSSSRAESYWEIFCIFMTRNTNHNAFILLYRKNPKQNTGDTGKNRNCVFFYCVGLSDQPHWREGTPKPSFHVFMIILEKIVQWRFSFGLYLLANKCKNIWFTIYIF